MYCACFAMGGGWVRGMRPHTATIPRDGSRRILQAQLESANETYLCSSHLICIFPATGAHYFLFQKISQEKTHFQDKPPHTHINRELLKLFLNPKLSSK